MEANITNDAIISKERPFCATPLWDMNLTWYTDSNPDFTPCFHKTVLQYIPFAILILILPYQIYAITKSRHRGIPISLISGTRILLTFLLIVLELGVFIWFLVTQYYEEGADINVPIINLIAYLAAGILHILCIRYGLVTSGGLFAFWITKVVCGAFTFRTVIEFLPTSDATDYIPLVCNIIEYTLICGVFLLNCWADPRPSHPHLEDWDENPSPENQASFLSQLFFVWFEKMALKGWKQVLKPEDLWGLSHENKSASVIPDWDKNWNESYEKAQKAKKTCSVIPTLVYTYGPKFAISGFLQLVYSILQFANPQIVNLLITFVSSDEPTWKGYFYTALICAVTFLNTLINAQGFFLTYKLGLRLKSAMISAIYRKSLRLSNTGRKEMTIGEATNLMAIDTQKFMDLLLYLNMAWTSPIQIALAVYFLWGVLGPASMAGLAVMVLMIPLNAVAAKKMQKYQVAQMKKKDNRSRLMDEVLNGMKVLKLYAWEKHFKKGVNDIRNEEMSQLIKAAYVQAFTTFLWTSAPFLVALCSFATYVLSDPNNVLDANTAFVSLTLFNLLRIPLNFLPSLLVYLVQCGVSVKRVNTFMNADELDANAIKHDKNEDRPIVVEKGTFNWESTGSSNPKVLSDINLSVKKGSLVAVVGHVGSGKSSLISAMLGEMNVVSGSINTNGKIAYVPQQAWMQNETLKNNITFGKKYNDNLYKKVIESCALIPDLQILQGGDQTEIGEKGINLSGGQKQRISMARAVYSNSDLYLLDDPLSAVDSHVGKHMFEQVIGPTGLLKHKTRILVTHGIGFLKEMDDIVVMKDGKISEQGTYDELLKDEGAFADFLIEYLTEQGDKDELDPQTESELEDLKQNLEAAIGKAKLERAMSVAKSNKSALSDFHSDKTSIRNLRNRKNSQMMRQQSKQSDNQDAAEITEMAPETSGAGERLIEDEKAGVGGVDWKVYKDYAKSVGYLTTSITIFFYVGYQGFSVGGNTWLSDWSVDPLATTDISVRNKYLAVYGVLGFFQSLCIMIATAFISIETLKASTNLHYNMLTNIMSSKMSFFDTTPLGRILNRFSKDVDVMDTTVPMCWRTLLVTSLNVVGTIFVICYTNPLFIAVIIPIGLIYYFVQKYYIATARQVKRLEAITRSPIYSQFGETISGAPTIRAFNSNSRFISQSEKRVDYNQQCYYPTFVSSRWLTVRLETTGNLIILFASLFAVLSKQYGTIDAGDVGLSLSYALNVTGSMNMLVRMTSEVETNMVSAERIFEYQETPQEAPAEIENDNLPRNWPQHGVVKFDRYSTRYREGLDLVLKDVCFETMSSEKLGIVGRTGAGKSSLTLSLFRLIEAAGGEISIDGVNIAHMGLANLRSRLTIIPQDPFLFAGTMRINLDPLGRYSDKQIWSALELAHLRPYVSNLPEGLDYKITEGGDNLSVGQRQLVCLARAVLRKTKVLVLDEATAAVDLETDDLIQATIRSQFVDCTVITIAHRLNTILDSTRVIVLDDGKIKEFDTPEKLLLNKKSQFYSMVKNAGLLTEEMMN